MNHDELRRECEPSLYDLIEERTKKEIKAPPEFRCYVDYELVSRVLMNERMRELGRAQICAARVRRGQLEKRLSSSLNGKKANRA